MNEISRLMLGFPYLVNPLVGDARSPEVFAVSLHGFDCVTYVETVLAMARAGTVGKFLRRMRQIRYRGDRVEWKERNHYMTGWIRANQAKGTVRNITRGPSTRRLRRRVGSLEGLRWKTVSFSYFPKRSISRIKSLIEDGDLIFFVSTRRDLDIFHVGICFRGQDGILLRHSSRSQGGVVEQPLDDFVRKNSMPGVILARPTEA